MQDDRMDDQESAGAATEPQPEPEATASPLEAMRREKDTLQDQLLRTAAEFDNYRKRVERDRRDQAEAATASALTGLLPI
jgi:molecular chaperone GrpE